MTGVEAIRKRPGMYIGGVDSVALQYMIMGSVNNVIDQHIDRTVAELLASELSAELARKRAAETRRFLEQCSDVLE